MVFCFVGRKVVVRQGFGGMRLLACRLGLFAARHRVQYIPFLVNHAQFQCLLLADTMEKPGSGLQNTVPSMGFTLRASEPAELVI